MAKRESHKLKRRGRERPVEFRGLSTHYVLGGTIDVTFRYPATSFLPHRADKVKLYRRGAQAGEPSIASASVGDVTKHRLCDGGLYKFGTVAIPTAALGALHAANSYVLLYGSCSKRKVVGKSQPFIICPQSEYPSMQIRGLEDRILIQSLRAHSPITDKQPMFPKGITQEEEEGMSFVMVSDNDHLMEEWESLGGEVLEGREDRLDGSWEDCGRVGTYKRSQSYESSDSHSSEEHILMPHNDHEPSESDSSDSEEANLLPEDPDHSQEAIQPLSPVGNKIATQIGQVKVNPSVMENGPAVSKPTETRGVPNHDRSDHSGERESTEEAHLRRNASQDHLQNGSNSKNGNDRSATRSLLRSNLESEPKEPSLHDDAFIKAIDMSESMVIVEDLSPSQILMIKNANKELRAKVRILHSKLQAKNNDGAASQELREEVSQLKQEKGELKRKNRKLSEEKSILKEKVKQLECEVSTLSHHCEKQVGKINQYETQLKLVNRKAEELQKRVHHLEKQSDYTESQRQDCQKSKPSQRQDGQKSKPGPSSAPSKKLVQERREKDKLHEVAEQKNVGVGQATVLLQRPIIEVFTTEGRRGEKMEEMEKKQLTRKKGEKSKPEGK